MRDEMLVEIEFGEGFGKDLYLDFETENYGCCSVIVEIVYFGDHGNSIC